MGQECSCDIYVGTLRQLLLHSFLDSNVGELLAELLVFPSMLSQFSLQFYMCHG